jgi:hypothetical protein
MSPPPNTQPEMLEKIQQTKSYIQLNLRGTKERREGKIAIVFFTNEEH